MDPNKTRQIKLKTAEELVQQDLIYITEHPDEFNEEDRDAWAHILNPNLPDPDAVVVESEEITPTEGHTEDPAVETTPTEEIKAVPAPVLTKDDFEKILQDKLSSFKQELTPKQQIGQTQEIKKIFTEDPKDWDDVAERIIQKAQERQEQRLKESGQKRDEFVAQMVNQYTTIAKENSLPDVSTKEGQELFNTLDRFGAEHGQTTFQGAYKLWSKIPVALGGGYKTPDQVKSDATDEEKKAKLSAQKQAAAKVGSGVGNEKDGQTSGKKYADVKVPWHVLRERMAQ